ncbi:uncharacterized protein LOC131322012 isoform X2 [Rhododendron vialii]|uniref:uncharacterized protein LOC131322012 isoform X2 n=1 Tax=Rhododendron vialii TaxID=182163 RepID=UPI00265FC86A|nr:uncharacterized protein LOC131322012 isoform X2 [Rhododendron vialii]
MGKELQHQESGITIKSSNPGCMWGILHVLHHHRWHHARRKMLPLKRHGGGKHGVGNPGNKINDTNASEMQESIAAEMNAPFKIHQVGEKVAEPVSVAKSSMKSRIKALIVEEVSKRRGRHRRSSSYPARIQLTRTDSIHHLEPSDYNPLTEVALNDDSQRLVIHQENEEKPSASSSLDRLQSKGCEEPVTSNTKCEFCELNITREDLLLAQTLGNAKEDEGVSLHESKQFLDVLDAFNMNKELFMKVLQEPNRPLDHYYYSRRAFNSKMGFTKSISFPFAKEEENTQVGIQFRKSAEFHFSEFISELKGNSSMGSPTATENQPENKGGIKGFKNLKQRIKRAMRESRKEGHRITMDAVLHKIPYGRKFSKDVGTADLGSKSSHQIGEKVGSRQMKRLSSFDESMDRYRRLYESSFNTQAKQHISERLKLTAEETPSPRNICPKPLGRILSMPDIRSNCYFQSEDSPDANSIGMPTRNDFNSFAGVDTNRFDENKTSCLSLGLENENRLDAYVEKGSQEKSVEIGASDIVTEDEVGSRSLSYEETEVKGGFAFDDLGKLNTTERDDQNENEIEDMLSPDGKGAEPSPISVLESSQEDITSPTKFSWSEETDSRLEPRSLFSDESETMNSLTNEARMDSPNLSESIIVPENIETSIEQLTSECLRVLVNPKDAAEFNYVKHVLELSGFSRDELLGTWHSPGQPVDPTLFEEVESCMVLEPHYPENEEGENCDHLLLFDLINEVLLEIYERSFTYWPKPLSSNSHMRPIPVGYHVLEEVWANISWYLSWKPEVDLLLDDSVTRDLAKGDGWMNLQFEAECVGLEIEDLIFDDLLEELVWT